jgi:hypothetical protein
MCAAFATFRVHEQPAIVHHAQAELQSAKASRDAAMVRLPVHHLRLRPSLGTHHRRAPSNQLLLSVPPESPLIAMYVASPLCAQGQVKAITSERDAARVRLMLTIDTPLPINHCYLCLLHYLRGLNVALRLCGQAQVKAITSDRDSAVRLLFMSLTGCRIASCITLLDI